MSEFTQKHDDFLVKVARWIKAHGEEYCPITAIKHVPNWRKLFDDLSSCGLVIKYKSGKVVFITRKGWDYLSEKHPEITRRRAGRTSLPAAKAMDA